MATVHNNIFVRGLTGSVGDQFVIRKTRSGKTIIANKPMFDENRKFTDTQKAHQEAFRQATQYAVAAKDNPVYMNLAKEANATAYNLAVADWFGKPQVLEIDTTGWSGQPGQTIRVKAMDDTQVTKVIVVIKDGSGAILLQDYADQLDAAWWNFTTTTAVSNPSAVTISATAYDLPGNTHVLLVNNN